MRSPASSPKSRREGLLDEDEHELLTGALGFTHAQVRSVVLGMQELVTVPLDVTLTQLLDACARTGFSRFPVLDHAGGRHRVHPSQGRPRNPAGTG